MNPCRFGGELAVLMVYWLRNILGRLEFGQTGQNHSPQLFGQPLQRPPLGFQHLGFILRQSLLDIAHAFADAARAVANLATAPRVSVT